MRTRGKLSHETIAANVIELSAEDGTVVAQIVAEEDELTQRHYDDARYIELIWNRYEDENESEEIEENDVRD